MGSPKFEIFLIFTYFLRSLFLYFQSLKSHGKLVRQFVDQVSYSRYHVSLYWWLIGSVLTHCKIPKYYDRDCLKIFFLLSTDPMMIEISGKMLIWFKKLSSVKTVPRSNGDSFLQSVFDLNWICKMLLTNNDQIWTFNATDLLDIFLKYWRNTLIKYKISKKLKFEEDWAELRPKFCLLRQSWAKYLE